MSAIPCPTPTSRECDCTKNPVSNFSLEDSDFLSYPGIGFPNLFPPGGTTLGTQWQAMGCVSLVRSTVSQADANQLAADQATLCQDGDTDNTITGTRVTIIGNQAIGCTTYCPDGLPFTYTVPAGRYHALTQAEANRLAYAEACQKSRAYRICLGTLDDECCVDQAFASTISVSGPGVTAIMTIHIVSGSLPPGLVFTQLSNTQGQISGIPTTGGTYIFTVQAIASTGAYMNKTFTLCAISIGPDPLDDGTVGDDYSQTLTATVCADTPLSWQVTDGDLPDGLTLDEQTGEISGTPTADGTFDFTVTLQTEAT